MTEIKTFVYFDIEATGLKSSGRPRISEISFVSLNTQEFSDLNQKLFEQAHPLCLSYGYYNAIGLQNYWFGQLQSH